MASGGYPAEQQSPHDSAGTSVLTRVALALGAQYPGRIGDIVASLRNVISTAEEGDSDKTGRQIVAEANKLKGLMRKVAQQMGNRKDLVSDEVIRGHLRSLQADCEKRRRAVVQSQMRETMQGMSEMRLDVVVKAGTIGEVSRVVNSKGKRLALKTINPSSKELYERDFDMFAGYFVQLATSLVKASSLALDVDIMNRLVAMINNLYNSIVNEEFQKNVMGEFDLRIEAKNLEAALQDYNREALEAMLQDETGYVTFCAPKVDEVAADGSGLVMEWIEGVNLSDAVHMQQVGTSAEVLCKAVVRRYLVDMFKRNRLHGDLHPGNMIVQQTTAGTSIWVFDFGAELVFHNVHLPVMYRLLKHIHCGGDRDSIEAFEFYKEAFENLGVSTTAAYKGPKQYYFLSKSFDLIEGMAGLNFEENSSGMSFLSIPAWVYLWQKAFASFVVTLQMINSLEDAAHVDMRGIIMDIFQTIPEPN